MRVLAVLSSFSLAFLPTLANIQISYYDDYDSCNSGQPAARYETIQRDTDSGNCIEGLPGYQYFTLRSTVPGEPLRTCGPFYYTGCSRTIKGSEPFDCSSCVAYTGDNAFFSVY